MAKPMSQAEKEKSYAKQIARKKVIRYIVLIFLTIICLFSFYIMIINSTRAHSAIQKGFSAFPGGSFVRNFKNLMSNANLPVWRGMFNSLVVSAFIALFSTYFSSLTAYAIHCYNFKGRGVIFSAILMIMMIPTQVTALGFVNLMRSWNLMNNYIPLVIPSIAAPVVFFYMKQYMEGALPIEIVEAARMDGSSEFHTFNFLVMPIMKPAIAVQAIFAFVTAWNNYFQPALLLNKKNMKTLPILIATLRGADFLKFDYGQVYMMILLSILPVVIVYIFLSKNIVEGVAVGSVKG